LQHRPILEVAGRRGDPREELAIEEKMLTETLVGAQLKAPDDGAQGFRFGAQRRTSMKASLRRSRR
ncbi:MAG: hypothetical protein ACREH6_07780, partial [Geminicoccaceae bacterium]